MEKTCLRHLIKPNWKNNELVIKTAVKPSGPSLPSKRPFGTFYKIAKETLDYYGYYQQIKQYDPGYYFDKYKYKPRKRVAGYLGQKLHEKKKFRNTSYYNFYQKSSYNRNRNYWNKICSITGESCQLA